MFQRGPPGPQGQGGPPGPSGTPGSDGLDVSIHTGLASRSVTKSIIVPEKYLHVLCCSLTSRGRCEWKHSGTKELCSAERGVFEKGLLPQSWVCVTVMWYIWDISGLTTHRLYKYTGNGSCWASRAGGNCKENPEVSLFQKWLVFSRLTKTTLLF